MPLIHCKTYVILFYGITHNKMVQYSLSGVAREERPPEHEEAGEGALRVPQDHALGLKDNCLNDQTFSHFRSNFAFEVW